MRRRDVIRCHWVAGRNEIDGNGCNPTAPHDGRRMASYMAPIALLVSGPVASTLALGPAPPRYIARRTSGRRRQLVGPTIQVEPSVGPQMVSSSQPVGATTKVLWAATIFQSESRNSMTTVKSAR